MRLTGTNFLKFAIFFIALSTLNTFAQKKLSFDEILTNYQYNKYKLVAQQTDLYLNEHKTLPDDSTITLLEINAVCNYALNKNDKARESFFKILKLDENYSPDPKLISPKIIRFFNKVKKDYLTLKAAFIQKEKEQAAKKEIILPYGELVKKKKETSLGALLSIIFPGSGHIYMQGANIKNVSMVSATTLLMLGSAYSIWQTEKLRQDYLNEVNPTLIEQKYESYNNAFKTRNYFLLTYAAVWTLTQLDFFWFSSDEIFGESEIGVTYDTQNFSIRFRKKL